MPQFTFWPDIKFREMPAAMGPFLEIVGYQNLQKRIQGLALRTQGNNFAQSMLFDRHALDFELWHLADHFRKFGRLPAANRLDGYVPDQLRAYSFIWLLTRVHKHLNPVARKRLSGRIALAFTDEEDLHALEHEMNVISHLCRFGCQVTCHDLEGDGGFDFTAERQGLEFEVECKMISADKGRQIHQYDIVKLGEFFQKAVDWDGFKATRSGLVIRLHIADRLPRRPELLTAIAKDAALAAAGSVPDARQDWRVERVPFAIEGSPFQSWGQTLSMDAVHDYVAKLIGTDLTKLLMFASQGASALILSVQSDKPDQLREHLYRELKGAAKQLSGTRPGALYAGFQDLSPDDVMLLGNSAPSDLDLIANRLFANDGRKHVYGVTYMSRVDYMPGTEGHLAAGGKVFRFINNNNPLAEDRRLRLDSDQAGR